MSDCVSPWTTYLAVRDRLGFEHALMLVERSGGTTVYVPKRRSDALEQRIGADASRVLADLFPGRKVEIPSRNAMSQTMLARERLEAVSKSKESAPTLARRLGITERRVRQIRHDLRQGQPVNGDGQLSLLD